MRRMLRRAYPITIAVFFAWHSCCAEAAAADPSRLQEARQLANGAADDLEAEHFKEAFDKAQRAEELYHAPPHLLMMAEALEGLGDLVKALDTYERISAEPLAPSAPAAFRKARELGAQREKSLLSRVPSILIDITGAPIEEARGKIDGDAISLQNGVATRINPGKHKVRVDAPGFKPVEVTIDVGERGGVTKVPIQLEVADARRTPATNAETNSKSNAPKLLVPGVITLGIGVAAVTAGSITGLLSMSNVDELKGKCVGGSGQDYRCSTKYDTLIQDTRRLSNISTSMFVAGGVATGVGVVLLILNKPQRNQSAFQIEPLVGTDVIGVRGKF